MNSKILLVVYIFEGGGVFVCCDLFVDPLQIKDIRIIIVLCN